MPRKKSKAKLPVNPPLHELNAMSGKISIPVDPRDEYVAELESKIVELESKIVEIKGTK